MPAVSLVECFADVPDPRAYRSERYPLPALLALVTLGLLLGRKSLAGFRRLHKDYGDGLLFALGFARARVPSKSSFSRLLSRLDPEAVEAALSRWVASRLPPGTDLLSLDGKTLRGSKDGEVPGQHLVSAYAPQAQAVLAQLKVDAKTNEHKAALRLLGILPLAGKVVVGDAMFCQRDVAEAIVDKGGDYVLMVKGNQPGLEADVAAGFGHEAAARAIARAFSPDLPPPGPDRVATSVDKGHGRLERRTLRTTGVLTLAQKWPGLAQGFELTRERTVKGHKTVEVVVGITSLGPEQADARRLLEVVRGHWLIENGLHWVRDVTMGEDKCRVRKGAAPQVLAALRNAVVHLLSLEAAREEGLSRAGACEHLAANPSEALQLLGIPQCE